MTSKEALTKLSNMSSPYYWRSKEQIELIELVEQDLERLEKLEKIICLWKDKIKIRYELDYIYTYSKFSYEEFELLEEEFLDD